MRISHSFFKGICLTILKIFLATSASVDSIVLLLKMIALINLSLLTTYKKLHILQEKNLLERRSISTIESSSLQISVERKNFKNEVKERKNKVFYSFVSLSFGEKWSRHHLFICDEYTQPP